MENLMYKNNRVQSVFQLADKQKRLRVIFLLLFFLCWASITGAYSLFIIIKWERPILSECISMQLIWYNVCNLFFFSSSTIWMTESPIFDLVNRSVLPAGHRFTCQCRLNPAKNLAKNQKFWQTEIPFFFYLTKKFRSRRHGSHIWILS